MRKLPCAIITVALVIGAGGIISVSAQVPSDCFMIKVVDDQTGRGVPLVEFKTSSHIRYYTDSQGIIAFCEPSLMNQQVYFDVFSHGYECAKSQYGTRGVVLATVPGDSTVVKIKRLNIAERLYRITGQDIYGASARLGRPIPIKRQGLNGKVAGQDTFIETVHKGKIYWFWGDTFGPGHFNGKASGATSELPGKGGLDPSVGIDLTYFVDSTGFSRAMCPIPGPGLVWIDWLVTVPDGKGSEKLYAKFSRTKTLAEDYERGIAVFNDSLKRFEKVVRIDAWLDKVHSSGHPVRVRVDNREYIYVIDRYGYERVVADSLHLTNALSYEHYTCLAPGTKFDSAAAKVDRKAQGRIVYAWKPATDAISAKQQVRLVSAGKIKRGEGLWQTFDVESGRPVDLEPVSVFWNDYRKCWVMLAYEYCGQVWYFEGDTPIGPWVFGQKIVTHEKYDFYNVGQHPSFDQAGGRLVYFEGTYTTGFSGSTDPTPLYNYNQMMYRLSLDDPRLSLPAPVYRVKDTQERERYLMRAAVDSLKLWDKIQEIPFFAVPPDRVADEMIPAYIQPDDNGDKITVEKPAGFSGFPGFLVAPDVRQDSGADPISGVWQIVAKLSDGSEDSAQFELTLRGQTVSGKEVTRGVYRDGVLDLQMQTYGFTISGTLKDGRLVGDLSNEDGTVRGNWVGRRVRTSPDKFISTALVPLYEYRDRQSGAWSYSTTPDLDTARAVRSEKPICRVWKNPSSLILLDYAARPVLYKTATR